MPDAAETSESESEEEADDEADPVAVEGENDGAPTTRSGRAFRAPIRFQDYETSHSNIDNSFQQAITFTPAEQRFYTQMKELNELQLVFSSNHIPCIEELEAARYQHDWSSSGRWIFTYK